MSIETLHGRVQFLQIVGLTKAEHQNLASGEWTAAYLIDRLQAADRLLMTSLSRA